MLLNATKCQGYSFYRFWVIKGKARGGGGKFTSPTQIRVKQVPFFTFWIVLKHFQYLNFILSL